MFNRVTGVAEVKPVTSLFKFFVMFSFHFSSFSAFWGFYNVFHLSCWHIGYTFCSSFFLSGSHVVYRCFFNLPGCALGVSSPGESVSGVPDSHSFVTVVDVIVN